jgi:lactate permease
MTLFLAILPIVLLIAAVVSPWPRRWMPVPASIALPAVALLAYVLQLVYFRAGRPLAADAAQVGFHPARLIHAAMIDGVLSSLTPLAIVFGAILLFKTMDKSGAMGVLSARLRTLSPDPVAQVMLIAWAFSFLIEGLSGFGTPAALAAPILVGLGFPPIRIAATCLIMNSVPVAFGAVGTPVWFGLGELGLSQEELLAVGFKAAIINASAALVVPALALLVVLPWRIIRPRLPFVFLVTFATVLPFILVSRWSTEFPSIIGGLTGLFIAVAAARARVGLPRSSASPESPMGSSPSSISLQRAAMPLLAVVVILAVTRIEPLGIRALLTSEAHAMSISLGWLGELWLSPALVVGLRNILATDVSWRMPLLYVPFILPFVAVALAAVPLLRMPRPAVAQAWRETLGRLVRPAVALVGALMLVKMIMLGGEGAPAMIMGRAMADAAGLVGPGAWPHFAPLLGALGSFFSGSNTVSNLTFGPVQDAVAQNLGLNRTTVLALQTAGGSMGNMVCIHNIVAVAAVLGIADRAGQRGEPAAGAPADAAPAGIAAILRLTAGPMAVYALIAAVVAGILAVVA